MRLHVLRRRPRRPADRRTHPRAVPGWREASVWFCGPGGFGAALRQDFAAQGFPVEDRFHQELFAMR